MEFSVLAAARKNAMVFAEVLGTMGGPDAAMAAPPAASDMSTSAAAVASVSATSVSLAAGGVGARGAGAGKGLTPRGMLGVGTTDGG